MESITIPDSITEIGKNAFYDCNGLKFVDLGHGVTSIGINAFRNDDGLESITIPDSVTEIKDSAFYDCDGLNYVDLGHGVTAIKEHAFYSCDNLKTVKNGEKISAIDQQVFYGTPIEQIDILSGIKCDLNSIGNRAFYNCKAIKSIVFPEGLVEIGEDAFSGKSGLEEIVIPESVKTISDDAFNKCNLKKMTIYEMKGSTAEEFAAKKKIAFSALGLQNDSTISKDKITLEQKIAVNCAASYGDGGYTYEVSFKKSTSSKWTTKQDFSANDVVTLKFGSPVTYYVRVKVKDSSDNIEEKIFTVKVSKKLDNLSSVSAENIKKGATLVVNADASGGDGDYLYKYSYRKPGNETWILKKGYSSDSTCDFKLSTTGSYEIRVIVKDGNGMTASKVFTVTVYDVLRNTSTISSKDISLGDTITVNCSAKGGLGEYKYYAAYKIVDSSTDWTTVKRSSFSNGKFSIKLPEKTTYKVRVRVKDSLGNYKTKTFIVNVN